MSHDPVQPYTGSHAQEEVVAAPRQSLHVNALEQLLGVRVFSSANTNVVVVPVAIMMHEMIAGRTNRSHDDDDDDDAAETLILVVLF